jgi:4-amino-4-deoxy-L-arabinose transferase-like glycosyltransferase
MTEHIQKKTLSSSHQVHANILVSFLVRNEYLIPLALFLVFLAFTLPGISWGAPSVWHPDEIVVRSMKALDGEWQFSETNFDYPDLPQYTMYWLGKLVLALGYGKTEILVSARVLSAVLAGLVIVITYLIARRAGGSIIAGGLSGLSLLCVGEMVHNAHFAHNDTYVMFFTALSILMLLQYHNRGHRGWLYAAFLTTGMAASSKYIGGSLILATLAYYLFSQRKNFRSEFFSILETLFISAALTFLGYAIGTPKALFWMTFYFKRVLTALGWQINYGHIPGAVRGVIGQYQVLINGLGIVIFLLFAAGLVWAGIQIIQAYRQKTLTHESQAASFSVLLLALFALDLPMMVSYNYQFRYFLTVLPILAVFSGFFVEWLYRRADQSSTPLYSRLIITSAVLIVLLSFARLTSVAMLFMNDSRAPAGAYIQALPAGTSLEHTNYPPPIPIGHFEREHNYPIYFVRNIDDQVPTGKKYLFNIGEAGLDERQTTYLVTDSFTADKFKDPYTCSLMPVECDFFRQLATGQSDHYRLIKEFSYQLPAFLPQIHLEYVNPTIRIFERIP